MTRRRLSEALSLRGRLLPDRARMPRFNRLPASRNPILALGDSHARVIAASARHLGLPVMERIVRGATAQGLVNPNAITDALGTFDRRIAQANTNQHLMFMLGEVDCGSLI